MLGASRTSNAALQEYLTAKFAEKPSTSDLVEAGHSLFAVVGVLSHERTLRATLADPSVSSAHKDEVLDQLFDGKITDLALAVFKQISSSRWSSDADFVDVVEESGATLVLMGAESNGKIDRVEEELFRFGRAIDANADLQMALTDPASSSEIKSGIVNSLLEGKAADETIELVAEVSGNLRGRRIQDAVTRLSELAAARRGQVIADVKAAVALSDEQRQRLAAALAKLHGRPVELNVAVDPSVLGGIEVRVGDEVIDGTAATKLEQARRRLTN